MKKSLTVILICILFTIVFSACKKNVENYEYNIIYVDKSMKQLVYQGYTPKETSAGGLVDEFINMLKTEPKSQDAITPGFNETDIIDYEYTSDGYVIINFNSGYYTLASVYETLCRAAIVKTLCQIEGVQGVEFYVDGAPYKNALGEPYGYMTAELFVDNTSGETTYKQTISTNLYFASSSGKRLVKVPANVSFDGTISIEQLIIQQLIKGPQSIKGVNKSLITTIPEKTQINQITVREQICYVDLSWEFLSNVEGVNREVTLYSVVNSLADLPDISKVQFSIDGETMEYFGDSDIVFDVPLERNLELIKEEN